ncbi:MAG: hypothetical protein LUG95_03175 [Clostridiales bacterium]|nr:hypothetical protein [Clostridiales bacterium]
MENKLTDAINYLKNNDSERIKIIVAVGLIGILLIGVLDMFSNASKDIDDDTVQTVSSEDYADEIEQKLTEIISSINGVGECKIMVTLENSSENVYATDVQSDSDTDSSSTSEEYVIYDSNNDEEPVLLKEYYPKILGVTIVCSGGDDVVIKETVTDTVTSLFNISTNRVSVSKIKE